MSNMTPEETAILHSADPMDATPTSTAENSAKPTVSATNNTGGRVRFRVEPTTLDDAPGAAVEKKPPIAAFNATSTGGKSVLKHVDAYSKDGVLNSMDSVATTSSDSLDNLARALPPLNAATAAFIDSIPPYVTVRFSHENPSPTLPLQWIFEKRSTPPSSTSSIFNSKNYNKSSSYTSANHGSASAVSSANRTSHNANLSSNFFGRQKFSPLHQQQQQRQEMNLLSQAIKTASGSSASLTSTASMVPTKHVQTEYLMTNHALKARLHKQQRLLDNAFGVIFTAAHDGNVAQARTSVCIDALAAVAKVFNDSWQLPSMGLDLAYGLCDYVREKTYLDVLVTLFLNAEAEETIRAAAGEALEGCFSYPNREYVINHRSLLEPFVVSAKAFSNGPAMRVSVSLFESLFKQNVQTNGRLIALSALDYVLQACKSGDGADTTAILRHAACALANLSMYSDHDGQQRMIDKNVPDWLFLLASSRDDVTRYYACLAICALVANKEIETAVVKSGTLGLVEPFLTSMKPGDFSALDQKHRQGRRKEWLERLMPMLSAKRCEPRAVAAFHFAVEADVKKKQERLDLLREIGAVDALKQTAALPDELASKFASLALEIVGEELPHKLCPQVPLWKANDVQYWVSQIGFEPYASAFEEQKVDGDLLLLLSDEELRDDIGMTSGLCRKRFMRELDSLKMAADYGCIDETRLDRFLVSVDPHFSVYTYKLLEMGVDCAILPSLSDSVLRDECGITNPVHRLKLLNSLEECKHVDDVEVAILSKRIDIFISYRRSTGNQLASLLKVLLQLRGHKVFIDVDRLYAGQFDASLLKNIQAAKHFVLVLTPNALDRCVNDEACHDWVHKEVRCALEHNKNVIPVLDPRFEWPDEYMLPADMRAVTRFNAVRWVHEYQEACVTKLEKFIKGELNVNRGFYPSLPQKNKYVGYHRTTSKPGGPGGTNTAALNTDSVLDALTLATGRSANESSRLNGECHNLQNRSQDIASWE